MKRLKSKLSLLLTSFACLVFNPAMGQNAILTDRVKAKTAANCAASMFSTGTLKILYNQQSDFEAESLMKAGTLLLYLSALYSSQDNAFDIYDNKHQEIMREIIKASNGGVSRAGIADYILNNLAPQNERCLKAIKDLESKMAAMNAYAVTPDGISLGKAIKGKTVDKIIQENNSGSKVNSINENIKTTPAKLTNSRVYEVQNLSYIRPPKLQISDSDLQGETREIRLKVLVNDRGRVDDVEVIKSTGLPNLDGKIVTAMRKATFNPHKENGIAIPVITKQTFTIRPNGH